jgi:hypothetical protein
LEHVINIRHAANQDITRLLITSIFSLADLMQWNYPTEKQQVRIPREIGLWQKH